MTAPRRALVLKLDTLGDLVLLAPALQALRAAWPAARLTVVVRAAYAGLTPLLVPARAGEEPVEWLTTTLDPFTAGPDDAAEERERLLAAVRERAPEVVVAATARGNWLEAALAAAAPDARRVALGEEAADAYFSTRLRLALGIEATGVFPERVIPPAEERDWRRGLRLASAVLGRAVPAAPPRLQAEPDPARLAALGLTRGRYAVCAAAGFANVRLKTWPVERFAAVAAHLRQRHGLPTLWVGAEAERAHLAPVAGPHLWLGQGPADLPALAGLLAGAAVFLGNDTGAMHLAAATGVPTIGIFGGGTWPRFQPAAAVGAAVVHPLPCFGCGWDCPFGDAPCLRAITAADVSAAVDAALAGQPFTVSSVERIPAEVRAVLGASAARHREAQASHLARQHKLEELTALAREKDRAIAEKQGEIAALKGVCDEREKTILILDGHVKSFQAENNVLKAEKEVRDRALAAVTGEPAQAARALEDQAVHIRNLEAVRIQQTAELEELRRGAANREAGLHDLEQAKHYGRLLGEKELVIRELSAGIAHRDRVLRDVAAETTHSTADLRRIALLLRGYVRERWLRPLQTRLFRRLVEGQPGELGVLRQHEPRPLRWDRALARHQATAGGGPSVAVVTPSYGQERFLGRTLASVLDQNFPGLRYVVQDGGSRDGSAALIARHAARLRHWESVPDRGQADAIRRGFAHVEADLGPDDVMAWLNSDDLLAPGSLAFAAGYFARHPEVDVIYGHRILIDEEDREIGRWVLPRHDPATLEWVDYVPQETLFWRKRAWDRVGGIDPTFQFALDWDLLARFQQASCVLRRVPYFLGAFRVHAEQKTATAIHTTGAEEMRRIRARFHGERADDGAQMEHHARRVRFHGALTARLLAFGLRW
ncbi:MAG: glycosyltransferase family 9 protein [Opitutaceae bacterium]